MFLADYSGGGANIVHGDFYCVRLFIVTKLYVKGILLTKIKSLYIRDVLHAIETRLVLLSLLLLYLLIDNNLPHQAGVEGLDVQLKVMSCII